MVKKYVKGIYLYPLAIMINRINVQGHFYAAHKNER